MVGKFVEEWAGRGYEKGETHSFWLSLLRDVLEIEEPEKVIAFEVPVQGGYIDALIEDTSVLIEQKSKAVKLDDSVFQQAKDYDDALEYSRRARWIVTCNFQEFVIYDMEERKPEIKPLRILLAELPDKAYLLDFLIDRNKLKLRKEDELSVEAGKVVDKLYETLKVGYLNPDSEETLQNLNKLCVRLVFCLYADSAGIFGRHGIFTTFIETENDMRRGLRDLFKVLNTPENERDPYDDRLNQFPYVNGGLFADDGIEIPRITPATRDILLNEICTFKWKDISPTIFGAVFESTINAKFRRKGGMHYTSQENILKVVEPLFLGALRRLYWQIKSLPISKNRSKKLQEFQDKLASIKILDPACGSGNFLTASFICLRRLENEVLRELLGAQIVLGEIDNPVKVSIQQFYGIEVDDFAVAVAKTALWISELQMLAETAEIVHKPLEMLPLRSYPNIHLGNALTGVWGEICPVSELTYIISNPPFVGKSYQTSAQKKDMTAVFEGVKGYGNLDYVACWFKKAADFIAGTKIRCAFVSTNSVCQGIAVPPLWKYLFAHDIKINFAYRTFKWQSETPDQAAVHCVIIGFSLYTVPHQMIFDGDKCFEVQTINAYLLDAPTAIVEPVAVPLSKDVLPMIVGSCPTDGGNLLIEADEYDDFIQREPLAQKFILPYIGSEEFINGKQRYCLWLKDCPPSTLRKMPLVMQRIKAVRDFRLASKKAQTRRRAETPTLFAEDRYIATRSIFIPMVSSENRRYVPIGFTDASVVVNNKALFIPNGDLYTFGVLTSSVHMAWMKTICGRLENRYSYSATVVYNPFPWCRPTPKQKSAIEKTAQKILDIRSGFVDSTLADLYNELTMPKVLRDAHRENDKAVMAAYGFSPSMSESEIVAALMTLYQKFF